MSLSFTDSRAKLEINPVRGRFRLSPPSRSRSFSPLSQAREGESDHYSGYGFAPIQVLYKPLRFADAGPATRLPLSRLRERGKRSGSD
jgi:hypothetical protein